MNEKFIFLKKDYESYELFNKVINEKISFEDYKKRLYEKFENNILNEKVEELVVFKQHLIAYKKDNKYNKVKAYCEIEQKIADEGYKKLIVFFRKKKLIKLI